jgi:hypothetical protein
MYGSAAPAVSEDVHAGCCCQEKAQAGAAWPLTHPISPAYFSFYLTKRPTSQSGSSRALPGTYHSDSVTVPPPTLRASLLFRPMAASLPPHFLDSPYRDQPLKPGEIRLLKIEWHAPLRTLCLTTRPCALEYSSADIPNGPLFDTVSYVWGTGRASMEVTCNGARLRVSSSTYEMLVHLHLHRPNPERLLWIDAISINQGDAEEKATQIPLMRRIYGRAVQVVVWLGPSIPGTDAFMTQFERVSHLAKNWTPTKWTNDVRWRGKEWPLQYNSFWTGLFSLLNHDWFRRLWTFQEIVLSKQAMILCGSYYIDGDTMFEFVRKGFFENDGFMTYNAKNASTVPGRPHQSGLAFDAIAVIDHRRKATDRGDWETPLLLSNLRTRHVKEPVDRVWAIVGLLEEDLQSQLSSSVDYTDQGRAEYWKTYVCFAKAVIKKIRSLKLLIIPRSVEQRVRCMPSWCPYLSGLPAYMMHLNGSWNRPTNVQHSIVQPLLHSGNRKQEHGMEVLARQDHPLKFISIVQNDDLLQTRGIAVDKVSEVVEDSRLFGTAKVWHGLTYPQIFQHPLYATFLEFQIQALGLARRVHSGSKEPTPDIPLEFLMCLLTDERVSEDAKLAFRDTMTGMTTKSEEQLFDSHPLVVYYFTQCVAMLGHSFFSTEGGRFGVAHPGLKTGDRVCAIYGEESLHILRWPDRSSASTAERADEHAQFCGLAFIPYLMKEHQWDAARLGPHEIFTIA